MEADLPYEISKNFEKSIRRVFDTKEEQIVEFAYQIAEGKTLHYYTRWVPEFNDEGLVKSVLCIARDITKRKETELRLLAGDVTERKTIEEENYRMRETLENVVSSGAVGIRIVDRNYSVIWSNESSEVVYFSINDDQPCEIFSYAGGTCLSHLDCDLAGQLGKIFSEKKEIVKWEQQVIRNGKLVWLRVIATPIHNKLLEVESVALFLIPITELKSALVKL